MRASCIPALLLWLFSRGLFSFCLCRFAVGFTGPLKDTLKDEVNLTKLEYSLFSAIFILGALVGALAAGPLTQIFGRPRFDPFSFPDTS